MRKRQINNMHGGYRGRGVTINWGTTSPHSSEPIIQPLPEPYPDPIKPLEPPPLPNVPIKPVPPHSLVSVTSKSHPNIAGIVGLTLGGVGALTAIGVAADKYMKSRSGIVDEKDRYGNWPELSLFPDTDEPDPPREEEKYPQSEEWSPQDESTMNKLWKNKMRLEKERADYDRRIADDPVEFHYY